jgi:hypothetical protein
MAEAIWRVNMTNRTVTAEAVLESWRRLGGRGRMTPFYFGSPRPPSFAP